MVNLRSRTSIYQLKKTSYLYFLGVSANECLSSMVSVLLPLPSPSRVHPRPDCDDRQWDRNKDEYPELFGYLEPRSCRCLVREEIHSQKRLHTKLAGSFSGQITSIYRYERCWKVYQRHNSDHADCRRIIYGVFS
jgi:hypothetical protein